MKINYSPAAVLYSRRFVLTSSVTLNDMGVVFRPESALQQQEQGYMGVGGTFHFEDCRITQEPLCYAHESLSQ